ncbi:MAG TPA: ABC exporter membrane fusion protein [Coleofasciculaceae cyanobacterium]|jgi:HlyD family secretion protein
MTSQLFQPKNRWFIGLIAIATAITGGTALYTLAEFGQKPATQPVVSTPQPVKVTALGRLEPEGEVVKVSAPMSLDGDRVAQVLVKEGDRVTANQVIAVLDSAARLEDAVRQAQEQVNVAQAKLAQVEAGAKTGEIQAQQAMIARLEAERSGELVAQQAEIDRWAAEVQNAQAEWRRYQELFGEGAISASTLDSKRLPLETAEAQLAQARATLGKSAGSIEAQIREAQATLNQIAEVRPVDVRAAQTEVDSAIAALQKAQTDLEQASIRAPLTGQILKIHSRAGEKLSSEGVVDMAATDRMIAVAEVYQTDIDKVKLGQPATVTGQAIPGDLRGEVMQIGLQVSQQKVYSDQPGENLDRRIVEVKIRLHPEDGKKVAGLTNLQVQTAIQTDAPLN